LITVAIHPIHDAFGQGEKTKCSIAGNKSWAPSVGQYRDYEARNEPMAHASITTEYYWPLENFSLISAKKSGIKFSFFPKFFPLQFGRVFLLLLLVAGHGWE
jgi:hypothetical protein